MDFYTFYLNVHLGKRRSISRGRSVNEVSKLYLDSGRRLISLLGKNLNVFCNEIEGQFNYTDIIDLLGKDIFNKLERNRIRIENGEMVLRNYPDHLNHFLRPWVIPLYLCRPFFMRQQITSNPNQKYFFWIDFGIANSHDDFVQNGLEVLKTNELRDSVGGLHFIRAKWITHNEGLNMIDYDFNRDTSVAGGLWGGERELVLEFISEYEKNLIRLCDEMRNPTDEDVFNLTLREMNTNQNVLIHDSFEEMIYDLVKT